MRALVPFLAAAVAVALLPTAAAEPPAFEFGDPEGDVTLQNEPFSGPAADANDVVHASMWEDGDDLGFRLELVDLSGLDDYDGDDKFHAQYALNFQLEAGHQGYSMRATYWGEPTPQPTPLPDILPTDPVSHWTFSLHDREKDDWTDVEGRQNGDNLEWTLPKSKVGADAGRTLFAWGVSAWLSYADDTQSNDWAEGLGSYVIGKGPEIPPAVQESVPGEPFTFTDPRGDVSVQGEETVSGPAADGIDVVSVTLHERPGLLVFVLELVDPDGVEQDHEEPGFHAQYALNFRAREGHAGYSMRADYRGTDMGDSRWGFDLHDREADRWLPVTAALDGNTLVWEVTPGEVDLDEGDVLTEWSVNTWNSYDDREQYGDWAATQTAYVVGHAPFEGSGGQVLLPAAPLALAVLAVVAALVLVRRR